jgi:D-sedoheptulose 7-phosphate isomerase
MTGEQIDRLLDEAFDRSRAVIGQAREANRAALPAAARVLAASLGAGRKVLFCGNGGSAADAQHAAAELVGRFARERRAWPALALTGDTSVLTAVANDYGFDRVFARQVEAYGGAGDALVAISTSGASPNVLRAVEAARSLGLATIGLTGGAGGALGGLVDVHLVAPSASTPRVQEAHAVLLHALCDLVERTLVEIDG